jgi:hypothetical protein
MRLRSSGVKVPEIVTRLSVTRSRSGRAAFVVGFPA